MSTDAPAGASSPATPFGLGLSTALLERAARVANAMFVSAGASIILVHNGQIWRSRYADILPDKDPVTESILKGGELFWIADGLKDHRFVDHPLVKGPPYLRFLAAVPIRLRNGSTPGVLSVSGLEPHPFDRSKAARLKDIADFVADEWSRVQDETALAKSLRERDEALERSERSEQRLNIALALTGVHVWEIDYLRRELVKAGAEDTFFPEPLTYDGVHGDIYVAVDPRDRTTVQAAWKNHVENGAPYKPEHRVNRPDGKEIWAQTAVKLFTDDSGRPTRMVGAIQNITARKHAERALMAAKIEADAANTAKSAFLATMSHELRTPLNAILGFAEVIREQIMGPAPAQYVGYARDIYASGEHLLALVNDILDISKLEAGKVELHEQEFDAAALVAETVASFRKQAESAGVTLLAQLRPLPPVRGDKRLLRQVLLNLLSNALKFTPDGGRVTLASRCNPGAGVEITVTDTGVGMSPGDVEVALTPFGQIDFQVARSVKGTGLGLPISRSLMKLHGGQLELQSEPQKGTRVTITLPETRVLGAVPAIAAL